MGKQMGNRKKQIKRKWDKKSDKKPPGKNGEAWRVPQEKDSTPWWEHHSHKNSIASGFKAKRQELESQLKSLMSDCKADATKSDECRFINKTLNGEKLKKFWESNPHANMLRWEHKTEEFIKKVEGMSKNLAASDKRLEFLRTKLAPLLTQANPDTSTLRQVKNLRRAVSMMEARQRLVDQYKTWQSQKSSWDASPIAKCFESRKAKFADSLMPGLLLGDLEQKAQHDFDMQGVWDECEKIGNKSLPFAKGGCFDKLADNYNFLTRSFDKLSNPNGTATENIIFFIAFEASILIIENECFNTQENNQTCHEYFKEALRHLVIEDMKNQIGIPSMSVELKWWEFQDTFKVLMDKEFWLNAPEDCWITSEHQAVGLADGMEKQYENVQNTGWPPGGL
jgi:hypothetical protein